MKERKFYRCVICGHIQEDAEEMHVTCEECDAYEWELDHTEKDDD